MGVVSVRYLHRDEPTAGEKNTAAGEKNTAAGEESGAAVGAFLKNIPQKKYTKWLDYDKIKQTVRIRTRQAGRLSAVVYANGRDKTVNALYDQMRRSRDAAEQMPVLCRRGSLCAVGTGRQNQRDIIR